MRLGIFAKTFAGTDPLTVITPGTHRAATDTCALAVLLLRRAYRFSVAGWCPGRSHVRRRRSVELANSLLAVCTIALTSHLGDASHAVHVLLYHPPGHSQ